MILQGLCLGAIVLVKYWQKFEHINQRKRSSSRLDNSPYSLNCSVHLVFAVRKATRLCSGFGARADYWSYRLQWRAHVPDEMVSL